MDQQDNKLELSGVLPLNIAMSIVHMLRLQSIEYNELAELNNYIFIKEIAKTDIVKQYNILDMCAIFFYEDDALRQNKKLYEAYKFVKQYVFDIYEHQDEYIGVDYNRLINSDSIFPSDTLYDYKHIYTDPNNIFRNLELVWVHLNDDEKIKWIMFAFSSLDYQLLSFLNNLDNGLPLLKKMVPTDDMNAIFEFMLTNYTFLSYFEHKTAYPSLLAMRSIYALSAIPSLDSFLRENLNSENLLAYNDILQVIHGLLDKAD